jgi:hypothetical protein
MIPTNQRFTLATFFIRLLDLDTIPQGSGLLSPRYLSTHIPTASRSHTPGALIPPYYLFTRSHPITKNCSEALSSLYNNFNIQIIGIDAISINQNNDREKSHHIPLMRDLHGAAETEYFWLGKGSLESDPASMGEPSISRSLIMSQTNVRSS